MIPRTVQMAKEVANQLTTSQLEDYGNIILNGYQDQTLGDMTAGAVGAIDTLLIVNPGGGYTPGTYTNVYLGSARGSFAYGDVVINGAGNLSSITLTTGGSGYIVGNAISFSIPGGSPTPALVQVDSVNTYTRIPALKGWTTNYQEYYTELMPNAYNVNPGDPTMFEYTVHSFTQATGVITALGTLQAGQNYTPGIYTNVATYGGSGTGATLNITVDINGKVTAATINNPGTGYTVGDGLGVNTLAIGPGSQFAVAVAATTTVTQPYRSKWAQAPRRLINNVIAPEVPPNYNSQANPYSAILYPVADREQAPPIGSLG